MMRRHYEGTVVPESKSLLDIEYLLRQHKVTTVRWTTSPDLVRIEFAWPYKAGELAFRIDVKVPLKDEYGSALKENKRDQERRRLLRVLLNHIKAKLIAVEDGLIDMEREFLPYLIGPGGEQTLGEMAAAELASGKVPERYPLLTEAREERRA